jgi:hypothetical protein
MSLVRSNRPRWSDYTRAAPANQLDDGTGDTLVLGPWKLWTHLPDKGAWNGLQHYSPGDPTFRQKIFFWREVYNLRIESRPHLIVTGRRPDATAPPLVFGGASNGWTEDKEHPFMVTGVNFPTLGCWEVTGDYHGDKLTFVVWLGP